MKDFRWLLIAMTLTTTASAQRSPISQFAVWKVNDGQLQNFENGYKMHLLWHKNSGDKSGWWGWFFVSGPRYGQFIDASFHHAWTDFDNAVNPGGDIADNALHVLPFAELKTIFKARHYPQHSTVDTFDNKLKISRMVTIAVDDPVNGLKIIEQMKSSYEKAHMKSFQVYGVVDGGTLNQFIILMGFNNWQEFGTSEDVSDKLNEFENKNIRKTIISVTSETLVYRPDMSWFPD